MHDIIKILLVSLLLTLATEVIIQNHLKTNSISDANRYIQGLNDGTETRLGVRLLMPLAWLPESAFVMATNFILFFSIGMLIFYHTKDWLMTGVALLGFSVSLMAYFTLLAQAFVMVLGLWLWTRVEPKGAKNIFIYLMIGALMTLTHKLGAFIVLGIFVLKWFPTKIIGNSLKIAASISGIGIACFFLFAFFNNVERVTFFYPFLLPMSLGAYDIIFWLGLFAIIFYMLIKTKDNEKELLFSIALFIGIILNYSFNSLLEIDAWRILIFVELIALLKIGKEKSFFWPLVFMFLLGLERLILGLL